MELLPAMEGEPPAPGRIRRGDRWRVSWHGRRDARLSATDPPRPYLESLRADAEAGQRAVTGWLHNKIVSVDREAVRVLTVLEQYRRDPVSRPTPSLARPGPDDSDPWPASKIPAWLVEARRSAAALAAYEQRILAQNVAEQRLGELGSIRHHLIEVARSAAGAHISRYEHLVGLYHAALLRRGHRIGTEIGRPPEITPELWIHSDLPLLTLQVDGELAETYRWFLKKFATSTPAIEHPIPIEVPRAG